MNHEDLLQIRLCQPFICTDLFDMLSPLLTQCLQCILTMITIHRYLQEERICHLWCCNIMHGIGTECLQCGVSEVFECICHESHIEYIVEFVVLTLCIDIECIPQFYHVIIFILWHQFTLHIINTLLARRKEGIAQEIVGLDESIEYEFLPCQ